MGVPTKRWDMSTETLPMVVEFNLVDVRLSTTIAVVAEEEGTMVEGHCELQANDHDDYHVQCLDPGFQESEHGCMGDGCHAERCLQKVVAKWCTWNNKNQS